MLELFIEPGDPDVMFSLARAAGLVRLGVMRHEAVSIPRAVLALVVCEPLQRVGQGPCGLAIRPGPAPLFEARAALCALVECEGLRAGLRHRLREDPAEDYLEGVCLVDEAEVRRVRAVDRVFVSEQPISFEVVQALDAGVDEPVIEVSGDEENKRLALEVIREFTGGAA